MILWLRFLLKVAVIVVTLVVGWIFWERMQAQRATFEEIHSGLTELSDQIDTAFENESIRLRAVQRIILTLNELKQQTRTLEESQQVQRTRGQRVETDIDTLKRQADLITQRLDELKGLAIEDRNAREQQ